MVSICLSQHGPLLWAWPAGVIDRLLQHNTVAAPCVAGKCGQCHVVLARGSSTHKTSLDRLLQRLYANITVAVRFNHFSCFVEVLAV